VLDRGARVEPAGVARRGGASPGFFHLEER
jgi:hypothetical protein